MSTGAPGVSFSEPRVTPTEVQAASTSVAAIHGEAERGRINLPVRITSFEEYQRIFGGFNGSDLPVAVKAFFDNGGGALWVNRLGHYTTITNAASLDAVKATAQLQNSTPTNTFLLGASSEGAWAGPSGGIKFSTTRVNTIIGTLAQATGTGPITSIQMNDVRRVYVGAQLSMNDGTDSLRILVTRVDPATNTVYFTSTSPTGDVANATSVTLEEFSLAYSLNGLAVETITPLAMSATAGARYFKDRINNGDPSRLIEVVTDNGITLSNTVDPRPADQTNTQMGITTAGSNGSAVNDADVLGSSAAANGLHAFNKITEPSLLYVPGRASASFQAGAITYVENRKDQFLILDSAEGRTVQQVVTDIKTTSNLFSEFAAVYYPWVRITDPVTGLLTSYPPGGWVMGMYARVDTTRNVARAPAGSAEGRLRGVLGVERELTEAERQFLNDNNINAIRAIPGRGNVVFGARTLANGAFLYINVRRVFIFVRKSLDASMDDITFEPNDATTRAVVRKRVSLFLLQLWRRKILKGRSADEAFFIVCDEDNNPASVEQQGRLVTRIGLAVARPSEFVEFELVQDTRALDAELAAAGL